MDVCEVLNITHKRGRGIDMSQNKYIVTPKGEFMWAHITKPDFTFKTEGQYHVKLKLKGEEAQTLKDVCDKTHNTWKNRCLEKKPQGKWKEYLPYKEVMDQEGMTTGVEFHFKMKASGINSKTGDKFTQRPFIVGPDKTPFPKDTLVGNGSVGKVAYEIAPYEFGSTLGVQLRLKMVQVLQLEEYGNPGTDVFEEEEGYNKIESNTFSPEGEAFDSNSEEGDDF